MKSNTKAMAKRQPPKDCSFHSVEDATLSFEVSIDRDKNGRYSIRIFHGDDLLRWVPINLKKGEGMDLRLDIEG